MESQSLGLSLLARMEQDVCRCQRDGSMAFLWRHFDRSLAFYYRALTAMLERHTNSEADKQFWEAYFWLAMKCLANFRSIGILVERGWHGSSYPLLRSMYADTSMIWYLHLNPHLLKLWLDEDESTYQKSKEYREAFKEATVFAALKKESINASKQFFQLLSKSAHGSGWGIRFFTQGGRLSMRPFPSVEHMAIALPLASGLALDLVRLGMLRLSGNSDTAMSQLEEELHDLTGELAPLFCAASGLLGAGVGDQSFAG